MDGVKSSLQQALRDWGFTEARVETWRDQNPKLFLALRLEKIGMMILLLVLLMIASFNIFGFTSLMVVGKLKEMAILKSIGLSSRRVGRLFLVQAASIGVVGSLGGGGLGLLVTFLLIRYPIRLPSSYYLEYLPLHLEPALVGGILLLIPFFCIASALYPSIRASRSSPVELLRYE
jgi:lipoprotein-releasing system permease protein